MRQILIERARARDALKRGGGAAARHASTKACRRPADERSLRHRRARRGARAARRARRRPGAHRRAALLRRPDDRGDGRGDGHLARDRQAPLGRRPRVARAGARDADRRDWRRVDGAVRRGARARRRPAANGCSRARPRPTPRSPTKCARCCARTTRSGGFLERPAWAVGAGAARRDDRDAPLDRRRASGRTQVREEVGRGGMGVVYAARRRTARTHGRAEGAAARASAATRRARERLAREARAAAALSHPGDRHDLRARRDRRRAVHRQRAGARLHAARQARGRAAARRPRCSRSCCRSPSALEAAHRHGIVHRDLEARERAAARTDGRVKVVDFGIARSVSTPLTGRHGQLTLTGVALGTPGYMAPEQLRGGAGRRARRHLRVRRDRLRAGDRRASVRRQRSGGAPRAAGRRALRRCRGRCEPPALDAIVRRCLRGESRRRASPPAPSCSRRCAASPTARRARRRGRSSSARRGGGSFTRSRSPTITIVNTDHARLRASRYLGASGKWVFLVVLVLATITTTLRLHLWFVSQVQPASLLALRARVLRWLVVCESLLLTALLATGIALVRARTTPPPRSSSSPRCSCCCR